MMRVPVFIGNSFSQTPGKIDILGICALIKNSFHTNLVSLSFLILPGETFRIYIDFLYGYTGNLPLLPCG